MIILDAETGGLDPLKNPLLSIGAVDYDSGAEFYGECRMMPGFTADSFALGINGFTEAQITDPTKQSPAELYAALVSWVAIVPSDSATRLLGGQQVGGFDCLFLREAAGSIKEFNRVFGYRTVDLHSVAFAKLGESLSLDGILKALGLAPEPKPHNALTGARLERDAFKLLLAR